MTENDGRVSRCRATRALQWRTAHGWDTILLIEDGLVIGAWDADDEKVREYATWAKSPDSWTASDPADIDPNPNSYGDLADSDRILRRINQAQEATQ